MSRDILSNMDKALAAWGSDIPDWITALAKACDGASQSKIAADLGRTSGFVSAILANKYQGSTARAEELVRGKLMNGTVDCPVLGNLPMNTCQEWRDKSRNFSNGNMQRVQMYRACRNCPRNQKDT